MLLATKISPHITRVWQHYYFIHPFLSPLMKESIAPPLEDHTVKIFAILSLERAPTAVALDKYQEHRHQLITDTRLTARGRT